MYIEKKVFYIRIYCKVVLFILESVYVLRKIFWGFFFNFIYELKVFNCIYMYYNI